LELQELGEALKEISYPALELEKKGKNNIEIAIQSVNKLCPIRIHMCILNFNDIS